MKVTTKLNEQLVFVYHGNCVCIWESERKGNENGEGLLLKKITILESVLAVTQLCSHRVD